MRRVFLAATCALALLLTPGHQAAAQTKAYGTTGQQDLELAMGGSGGLSPNGRQLIIASAVGWFSGGMLGYRAFRTTRSTLVGIAIGTLFPLWVYLKQEH